MSEATEEQRLRSYVRVLERTVTQQRAELRAQERLLVEADVRSAYGLGKSAGELKCLDTMTGSALREAEAIYRDNVADDELRTRAHDPNVKEKR